MFEQVNEKVDVMVLFMKNRVKPLFFVWHNHKYSIQRINMIHSLYMGRDKQYFFSVQSAENYFKLRYNTGNNQWILEEVYYGE